MYFNSIWPGAYDFKSEIKLFVNWFKSQVDTLLLKIEAAEKALA